MCIRRGCDFPMVSESRVMLSRASEWQHECHLTILCGLQVGSAPQGRRRKTHMCLTTGRLRVAFTLSHVRLSPDVEEYPTAGSHNSELQPFAPSSRSPSPPGAGRPGAARCSVRVFRQNSTSFDRTPARPHCSKMTGSRPIVPHDLWQASGSG